ncbi:MAG: hypothetical protein EOO02_05235 [Chitinophagaceae bacterium]|nr:MAG: hypothetical protein EOO02_05235 [Chitinophagaceae bacterium]
MSFRITYPGTGLAMVVITLLITSCFPSQYYLSPFHANNQPYKAMPLRSDSVKSAVYAGGALNLGLANDLYRDKNFGLQGNIHRAHQFNWLSLYYGANIAGGDYIVDPAYYYSGYRSVRGDQKPIVPGNKFYGSAGISGGASLVIPFSSTGSEWRVLGVESNLQSEFGSYYQFRKNLPDTLVTATWKQPYYHTIGFTTNPMRKRRRNGEVVGCKFGVYFSPQPFRNSPFSYNRRTPIYFSGQLHFSNKNTVAFLQLNLGDFAGNIQVGVTSKLGKNKPR